MERASHVEAQKYNGLRAIAAKACGFEYGPVHTGYPIQITELGETKIVGVATNEVSYEMIQGDPKSFLSDQERYQMFLDREERRKFKDYKTTD